MERPFFSIVTCTKNSEKFLKECLDSASKQTCRNFEHIFVDAFSNDKTIEIIQDYIRENPDIVAKIIQAEPNGISNAMNIGIKNSQGQVLHFLQSDDYYYSFDSLDRVIKIFKDNLKASAVMGNYVARIRNKVIILNKNSLLGIINRFIDKISHPNAFVKRIIFNKYGMFDESIKIIMDREHFLRWNKKEKIVSVDQSFTVFRCHQGSISSSMRLPNKLIFLKDYLKLVYIKIIKSIYGR